MATSSIFASFDIKDKKTAEDFVSALDQSESYNTPIAIKSELNEMNDLNEIKTLWKKRK